MQDPDPAVVQITNLDFRFDSNLPFVLRDVSMTVKRGRSVGNLYRKSNTERAREVQREKVHERGRDSMHAREKGMCGLYVRMRTYSIWKPSEIGCC